MSLIQIYLKYGMATVLLLNPSMSDGVIHVFSQRNNDVYDLILLINPPKIQQPVAYPVPVSRLK